MNALETRKQIQAFLGVKPDGDIGPITIAALHAASSVVAKQVQVLLHVAEDGQIGPASLAALQHLCTQEDDALWPLAAPDPDSVIHSVKASSFADPADVAAFRKCKVQGNSDMFCFNKGDNGIGKWGDDCTKGSGPKCALPPEYWVSFGSAARHKPVLLTCGGKNVTCLLDDTMPHLANIHNGAGIDVNYDGWAVLGYIPPQMRSVTWQWA